MTAGGDAFQESGAARGIGPYSMAAGMTGGLVAADYDGDGDVDLFVPNAEGVGDQLYRNLGAGVFEEVAAAVGIASTAQNRSALWADVDGDDRLDLLVGGDCIDTVCSPGTSLITLYRQEGDGTFTDVTAESGLFDDAGDWTPTLHRSGIAAGDINGDGHLDLWFTAWCHDSRLFLNNGNGTFVDVTEASGVAAGGPDCYWQPVLHDFDEDGRVDLFVSVDFDHDQLWRNRGDGTFEEVALAAGLFTEWNDMGVALGDADNDGDADLFISNISGGEKHNQYWRNDSSGSELAFTDIAEEAGVDIAGWGWGTTFLDYDHDGWLDLAVTNGFGAANYESDASRLFRNLGGGAAFDDVSVAAGFDDTYWGSGLVAFDMDRDGDLDLGQATRLVESDGPLRLLENISADAAAAHYLVVRPRTVGPNRRAIGARVRVVAGELSQTRWIRAGSSTQGQEPAEAHFGLGSNPVAEEVEVRWPDGRVTTLRDVDADQLLDVFRAEIFADGFESGDLTLWSATVP